MACYTENTELAVSSNTCISHKPLLFLILPTQVSDERILTRFGFLAGCSRNEILVCDVSAKGGVATRLASALLDLLNCNCYSVRFFCAATWPIRDYFKCFFRLK